MADMHVWLERLADERSKEVVFLSHCLLNENTRYLGGACRPGCIEEILQSCLQRRVGIIQMRCPEQFVWGGVLKRRLLKFFGAKKTLMYRFRNLLLPIFIWHTRRAYSRLAREVIDEVEDYLASGFTVVGIVGVDGSPSCGVLHTLDMKRALGLVGQLEDTAHAGHMNEIVKTCRAEGAGLFVQLLRKELDRRGLSVPFLSHDLNAELQGTIVPLGL